MNIKDLTKKEKELLEVLKKKGVATTKRVPVDFNDSDTVRKVLASKTSEFLDVNHYWLEAENLSILFDENIKSHAAVKWLSPIDESGDEDIYEKTAEYLEESSTCLNDLCLKLEKECTALWFKVLHMENREKTKAIFGFDIEIAPENESEAWQEIMGNIIDCPYGGNIQDNYGYFLKFLIDAEFIRIVEDAALGKREKTWPVGSLNTTSKLREFLMKKTAEMLDVYHMWTNVDDALLILEENQINYDEKLSLRDLYDCDKPITFDKAGKLLSKSGDVLLALFGNLTDECIDLWIKALRMEDAANVEEVFGFMLEVIPDEVEEYAYFEDILNDIEDCEYGDKNGIEEKYEAFLEFLTKKKFVRKV